MSAFDLAGDHDALNLADQARANPLDLSQSAGFFSGMATGAATGVGRLLADTQRTTGLALGAVAGSFDMLTGDAIKAQEKVFEHIVTPADKLSRHLAPKPEEIGMAGQLLHGLIKIGGEAVAFGAPGVLTMETVGGTLDALDKGVDLQTAGKVGGVQGAATTAGVIAPMTLGSTGLGVNLLYGAGINLAQGIFQRGATSEIYAKAGRPDLAAQFKALDGEAMAVDAILGAAFAGGGRVLQLRADKAKADAVAEYKSKIADMLKPEQIDAALVKNEQMKMERSGMVLPADLPSRDAHVSNLAGAIDDLIEGRPVTVRSPDVEIIPDDASAKVQTEAADTLIQESVTTGQIGEFDAALLRDDTLGTLPRGIVKGGIKAIRDIITFARSGPANEKRGVRFATVEDAQAMAILESIGADVSGYTHMIDNFGIRHALNEHGNPDVEARRGNMAITDDDILKAPEIVKTAERIESGGKDSAGRDLVRYVNTVKDGTIYYVEEVRTKRNELAFKTMWKKPPARDMQPGEPAPAPLTSETLRGSDSRVSQKVGAGETAATVKDSLTPESANLRPDAVIPLNDTDATATVADVQSIIDDLEIEAREQETGLRAAVACFLRAT